MKNYLNKGLYFCIPFIVIILFIIIIDPYEFINISHVIESKNKIQVYKRTDESYPRGSIFWKVIHFKRNPKKNIIFGDSQGASIKESLIKKLSGKDFYNFCIPGSSYETMFQTFWYASENINLESVYFQVGFMNYNSNRSYNLFPFAQDYIDKPYLYFVSKDILFDSFINLFFQISKNKKLVQRSYEYATYEELEKLSPYRLNLFFNNYCYPSEYYNELKKISDYCKSNKIELKFIILPTYKSTHEYISKNNLLSMNSKFKNDIKSFAYTYDFDIHNSILSNKRDNFLDYFHPKDHVIDELTEKIWKQ